MTFNNSILHRKKRIRRLESVPRPFRNLQSPTRGGGGGGRVVREDEEEERMPSHSQTSRVLKYMSLMLLCSSVGRAIPATDAVPQQLGYCKSLLLLLLLHQNRTTRRRFA